MKKIILKLVPFWTKLFISMCLYKMFRIRMKLSKKVPNVSEFESTVNYIVKNKASVSRFGDGEFKWMFQNREDGNFEMNSPELAKALKKTIKIDNEKLVICIPDVFSGLKQYNKQAREYWGICLGRYGMSWLDSLDTNKEYFDTQFTRPYMDYRDKTNVDHKFQLLKKLWLNRDVLIVEGRKSRFGVGNDLMGGSASIRRILAPETNAFENYNDIKEHILNFVDKNSDVLILLSLGPTATVLAAELSLDGLQAIDIGHLDIEYSWYLMGATKKEPVTGKYVNEVPNGGHTVAAIADHDMNAKYQQEIIDKVGI